MEQKAIGTKMVRKRQYALCASCDKPLTWGFEIHGDWDKCLECKIKEDGYVP